MCDTDLCSLPTTSYPLSISSTTSFTFTSSSTSFSIASSLMCSCMRHLCSLPSGCLPRPISLPASNRFVSDENLHLTTAHRTRTYTLQLLAVQELTLHRTLLPPSVTLPLHMFASCEHVTTASNISMSDTCKVKTCTFNLLIQGPAPSAGTLLF